MSLAERLRERHRVIEIANYDDDLDLTVVHKICNQDGQAWPCFTEQMILEEEQKT